MTVQLVSVFSAGLLSSLSPCVYPMIPVTIGFLGMQNNSKNSSRKVLLFFLGQVVAFTAIGLVAVQLGETFGFTSQSSLIQKIIGLVLLAFGLASFFNYMPHFLLNLNSKTQFNFISKDNFFFPFIVGVSSALIASPCSSPILGAVLTTLATDGANYTHGVLLMVTYALGASLIFLILGLGLMKLKSIPRAGAWMNSFHKISSVLIIFVGIYYLYQGFLVA